MKTRIDVARKPISFVQCRERHEVFAPSWGLLTEYQAGGMSWETYTQRYTEEMREAYRRDPHPFQRMAERLDDVELVCWCIKKRRKDERCHRFLLRAILEKIRARSCCTGTAASGATP